MTVEAGNADYASVDGVLYNKDMTELLLYPTANGQTNFVVPATVTKIGYAAFALAENLEEITFPAGLKEIAEVAFCGAGGAMTRFVVPEGVTTIGYDAFEGASYKEIVVPATVTKMGDAALWRYSCVEKVYYRGTADAWAAIEGNNDEVPEEVTLYFYSEEKPTKDGNFWHYDANGNIVVW